MRLVPKLLLAAAAVSVASAASFPIELGGMYRGTYPRDMAKREALKTCQANDPSFVRFLASDREACYARLREVGMPDNYSGVWSKHGHKSG